MKLFAFSVREDEKEYFAALPVKYGVELAESEDGITEKALGQLAGYDVVSILGMQKIDPPMLTALKKAGIRYVATRTIGYNHIDVECARSLGMHIVHALYEPNGVADYTIMMMLMCLRHYKESLWRTNVNDYSLTGLQGRQMKDLTVGVMGTGHIGATVIQELSGFGCRILAYDVHQSEAVKRSARYVDLETLYRECDIITLHMPLLPSTYHIINKESIAKMKDTVVLINCARGALMDIEDLIEGIEQRHIGALGLDVMEHEEGIVHRDRKLDIISNRQMAYLRQFPNVVHTQHMAFYTDAAVRDMVFTSTEAVLAEERGETRKNQVC
ncbi:MAG: D-isomer specific 2-hydroxyacid dehydrogenase family protein [Lachnospira sp.]|nr:D-isomer specific 2-hydroxyacid dehydrogenase family protein [Lachnospira sp.]